MAKRPNWRGFSQSQPEFFRILREFSLLFGRKPPETGTPGTASTTTPQIPVPGPQGSSPRAATIAADSSPCFAITTFIIIIHVRHSIQAAWTRAARSVLAHSQAIDRSTLSSERGSQMPRNRSA
jgi:hypothetical protein